MDSAFCFTRVGPEHPRLSVKIEHRIGALDINASFDLTKPWTVLFGPSGSGKSTILRAIAGLTRPNRGTIQHVVADDRDQQWLKITVQDGDQFISAHSRAIPLAPQSPSLFPHWKVADNITTRRGPIGRANEEEAFSIFRLKELRNTMPDKLSGGESQRVNLARAAMWTIEGGLLLLDEPFTGMDVTLRDEIIHDMKAWLAKRNVWVLSVTHDVSEAFQLGAEVIKIAEGKVVAQGPVESVLAEERERLLKQLQ